MPRPEERLIEQPRPHEPDAFHEPHRPADGLNDRLERLPRSHPSSPFRDDGTRKPPPPDYRRAELPLPDEPGHHPGAPREGPRRLPDQHTAVEPLTDAEYADHKREVRERLDQARANGLATDEQYAIDDDLEIWSAEREALHNQILDELYARADGVPNERQAIIAGGLPGAGKTTVLDNYSGINRSHYLTIDPDKIKEEMATRKLIPAVAGLTPMEASDLVHEESSHLAKRLARRALTDGKNVIWDITMSSRSSAEDRIGSLRSAGYTDIQGIFVDIPPDVSVRRTEARHRAGLEDFRIGRGDGGRFVPPEVTSRQADPVWGSVNRRIFEESKGEFDRWAIYDNSVTGREPQLIESSGLGQGSHGRRDERSDHPYQGSA